MSKIKMGKCGRPLLIGICTLLYCSCPAGVYAQVAGGGAIQGTITDPSGAVIPQADVTAVNTATGVETRRKTTGAGLYVISPLPAGEYGVRVTATGFETLTQEHVIVDALATVPLDLSLKVGASTQQVTVEATAALLHSDDATLGNTMRNNVYEALPLAMNGVARDPTQFVALIPGVAGLSTQVAGPSTASFNGAPVGQNEIYVEGLPLTFPSQQADTRNLALGVSVEAVDQFQVETSDAKAMYQGQGMENYVLKSGTNEFHGGVFEYFRNTDLDARGFFPAFTPIEHQNEFGGTIGGPIKKDKLFFFGSYDGYYYKTAQAPQYQSIPSLSERNGDFSAFPTTIYDPATYACVGAICSKQPFAGNVIPASRISSVSKSLQSYLPNPTNSGIQSNYLASLPEGLHNNNTTEKVDYNISDKNRMYGMYSHGKYATDYTGSLALGTDSLPLPYTDGRIVEENTTIAQIHDTYVFTPTLLNDVSFGYGRIWIPIISATAAGIYPTKAGITGLPAGNASNAFPTVNFAGTNPPIGWAGTNAIAFNQAENTYTAQDNVQWIHGKHSVTIGFQLQRLQDNNQNPDTGSGAIFSFSNNETAGFSPTGTLLTTTGNAYASYLLGAIDSASITQNYVVEVGSRFNDYGTYIQDDWKVGPRLTVNLGLRYDIFGPYHETHDRTSFLNPLTPNPAASGYLGALEFAGYGTNRCNCPNVPIKTDYLNFEPRIGVAFKATSKTVIRTGFAMNASHGGGTGNNGTGVSPGQLGFNAAQAFSSAVTGLPAFYWQNGVPPYQQPPFINPTYGVGFTTTNPTGAVSPNYVNAKIAARPPYYFNWNFSIEQELSGSTTIGAAYTASAGRYLLGAGAVGMWNDSMAPQYLALGPLLNAQATPANIKAAQAIMPVALPFANFQGTIAQMLKPFPQYSGLTYLWGNRGDSSWNAVQVTFDHRLSHGLTVRANYTYSKEIDNLAATSRDPYNGRLDRALGTIDHPNVFTSTIVYALPFGAGHNLGSGNPLLRAVVSNWQLSGLVTFNSGAPLSITGSGCNTPGLTTTCIVSYNPNFTGSVRINGNYGDGNATGTGALAYINKGAFIDPPAYQFGNAARNAPYGLFVPHILDEDISIRREFPLHERVRLALQADMFNMTNSVAFAAPGTNIDSANFGQVTSQANLPRKFQLVGRITF
ncbi:MAG TPA: TonB-dependent receptor [Bryobacteraceae bacterium]|nr:TonB-dependent receptor [Bryobacteraceae bacterium]